MSLQTVPSDNVHPNAARELFINYGTHHENHGYFDATLADADGITVTGRPLDGGWGLEQGAAGDIRSNETRAPSSCGSPSARVSNHHPHDRSAGSGRGTIGRSPNVDHPRAI